MTCGVAIVPASRAWRTNVSTSRCAHARSACGICAQSAFTVGTARVDLGPAEAVTRGEREGFPCVTATYFGGVRIRLYVGR